MNSPITRMHNLAILPEVASALAGGHPVVALESTIISHGMPYPQNVRMATEVEGIVRANGATPATVAVLDGVCCVGLSPEQLERLGTERSVYKATTRDLPWLVATQATGATTVAATMRIAALVGTLLAARLPSNARTAATPAGHRPSQ